MLKLRAFVLATPSTVDRALTDYDYEEDTRYIIHGDWSFILVHVDQGSYGAVCKAISI